MRFDSILVVCIGNICRSPVGERALAAALPDVKIGSAGLGAMVGEAADPDATRAAQELGISLDGHVARQWTGEIGRSYDLILTMEPDHRTTILRRYPEFSGKTFLFSHWTDAKPIDDPYKRSNEFHAAVARKIVAAADAWALKLKGRR